MDRIKLIQKLIDDRFNGKQVDFATAIKRSPAQIHQWLSGYRAVGHTAARHIETVLKLPFGWMDGKAGQNVIAAAIGTRRIPLINSVQAGIWTEIADNYVPVDVSDWLLTDLDLSGHAFGLEIKGDSMRPDFKEGDRIIVDPEITPNPGDFVVARNCSDEATFKKYRPRGINEHGVQVFELVPLNPDYETIRSDYSPITIIGTMMEHRRYRKR